MRLRCLPFADGRPAALSPVGVCSEWFRSTPRKASRLARQRLDREDVTGYLRGHPESFNLRWIPGPGRNRSGRRPTHR